MSKSNLINRGKDIDVLKNRLLEGKSKRLDIIDSFVDRIKAELDTRDLKDIPTPILTRLFIGFIDLAKKEYPQIELQNREYSYGNPDYKSEKVIL